MYMQNGQGIPPRISDSAQRAGQYVATNTTRQKLTDLRAVVPVFPARRRRRRHAARAIRGAPGFAENRRASRLAFAAQQRPGLRLSIRKRRHGKEDLADTRRLYQSSETQIWRTTSASRGTWKPRPKAPRRAAEVDIGQETAWIERRVEL
jgi:hypothetical protein